jgi:hypothetical protein
MERYNRKSIFSTVSDYCHLSGDHDYIEVIEWHNAEGFGVNVSNKNNNYKFEMSWGQFKLLKKMVKKLDS